MHPFVDEIRESFEYFEEIVFSSASGLSNIREAAHRVWVDISRYGPQRLSKFPDLIPGLGDFELPPPPPPTPQPLPRAGWLSRSGAWVGDHPWTASGLFIGVVGAGLLVGYGPSYARYARMRQKRETVGDRRQVVVVLGGDNPLGLPLILELEKKGYIVIASVATPEGVDTLEQRCNGFVRALVLDPAEPGSLPIFLRSLAATLSRRFPLDSPGDPHASPSSQAYIQSVISLLTLPASSPTPAPLESLSLRTTYLPFLLTSHIVPLQAIQALMPLLRTTPSRTRDEALRMNTKKTIVVCVPAPDTRVGLPFASAQAMSAAATLRGIEVLRREINTAALTDPSESMKNIKVVVVDVGRVGAPPAAMLPQDAYKAMEDWTASEKLTYGPAFGALVHPPVQTETSWSKGMYGNYARFGVPRQPTPVSTFVNGVVCVVSGGNEGWCHTWSSGVGLALSRLSNWIKGERFAVGAGANTYRLASYLPSRVLDILINLPYLLISLRNPLILVQPRVSPNTPLPPPDPPSPAAALSDTVEQEPEATETPETGSEAEVEGTAEDGGTYGSSWISLRSRVRTAADSAT